MVDLLAMHLSTRRVPRVVQVRCRAPDTMATPGSVSVFAARELSTAINNVDFASIHVDAGRGYAHGIKTGLVTKKVSTYTSLVANISARV